MGCNFILVESCLNFFFFLNWWQTWSCQYFTSHN